MRLGSYCSLRRAGQVQAVPTLTGLHNPGVNCLLVPRHDLTTLYARGVGGNDDTGCFLSITINTTMHVGRRPSPAVSPLTSRGNPSTPRHFCHVLSIQKQLFYMSSMCRATLASGLEDFRGPQHIQTRLTSTRYGSASGAFGRYVASYSRVSMSCEGGKRSLQKLDKFWCTRPIPAETAEATAKLVVANSACGKIVRWLFGRSVRSSSETRELHTCTDFWPFLQRLWDTVCIQTWYTAHISCMFLRHTGSLQGSSYIHLRNVVLSVLHI